MEIKNYIINNIDSISDKSKIKIKGIIDIDRLDEHVIRDFYNNRNLGRYWKQLNSIFIDCGCVADLIKLINNQSNVSSIDLLNHDNFNDLFNSFNKNGIEALMNFNPSNKGITRGDGEVLCNLYLNDIICSDDGDIPTKSSGKLEIKGRWGRLKNQASYNIEKCDVKFQQHFNNLKYKDVFKSQTHLFNILKELRDSGWDQKYILESLAKSFVEKYPIQYLDINELFVNHLVSKSSDIFKITKKKRPSKKDQIDIDYIMDILMIVDMIYYKRLDGWSNMLIVSKKNKGKYSVIRGEILNHDIQYIYDYLKCKDIERASSGMIIGDSQSHAFKIEYEPEE